MAGYKHTLRRLAVGQEDIELTGLDDRARAFVRLGALIALDAPAASYRAQVDDAVAAGATYDEIVEALVAVIPIAGAARVTSAASRLGLGLGYDVEAALEAYEST